MTSKIVTLVLVILLPTWLTISSQAQIGDCKQSIICFNNSQWYAVCVPPLPPGVSECDGFDFTEYCWIPLYDCPPIPCPTCNGATASQPIDLATGNTYIEQSDIELPGLGGGLSLKRRWNSSPGTASYGMFGHQWSSNFEEQVYVGDDHMIKHSRGDGSIWTYGFAKEWGPTGGTPAFRPAAPLNTGATMLYTGYIEGRPSWTITAKSGEIRMFSDPYFTIPPGNLTFPTPTRLVGVVDRNGNATTFSYDINTHLLTTVTDPASRHLYFSYGTIVVGGVGVSLVTAVTSDFGVSLSYQYDGQANLIKVTKPDNTFVSYEYTAAGLLTAVKDSAGKILESHTYDSFGRGLTSSRAGGVESVTVSYPVSN